MAIDRIKSTNDPSLKKVNLFVSGSIVSIIFLSFPCKTRFWERARVSDILRPKANSNNAFRTHDGPSVHKRVAKEIWDMAPERVYVCPFCDLEYAKASGARTCCR